MALLHSAPQPAAWMDLLDPAIEWEAVVALTYLDGTEAPQGQPGDHAVGRG